VLIPKSVYKEVVVEGKKKGFIDAEIVERAVKDGWIRVVDVQTEIEFDEIERGEAEAIELAQKESLELLVDDSTARTIASSLGVKPIGTLRVLCLAVKNGLISKDNAKKILNLMIKEGFRLSIEVYSRFLEELEKL
jgi:predicted nucleic acid-binding protein